MTPSAASANSRPCGRPETGYSLFAFTRSDDKSFAVQTKLWREAAFNAVTALRSRSGWQR